MRCTDVDKKHTVNGEYGFAQATWRLESQRRYGSDAIMVHGGRPVRVRSYEHHEVVGRGQFARIVAHGVALLIWPDALVCRREALQNWMLPGGIEWCRTVRCILPQGPILRKALTRWHRRRLLTLSFASHCSAVSIAFVCALLPLPTDGSTWRSVVVPDGARFQADGSVPTGANENAST